VAVEKKEKTKASSPVPQVERLIVPFDEIIGHGRAIGLLQSYLERAGLPPALLFVGERGIGKATVAQTFVATLFCSDRPAKGGEPCGQCLACRKIVRGTHPDFLSIVPEEEGSDIKIDQIRAMQNRIIFPPMEATRSVVVIDPADAMTLAAANSLLKTLEEAPSYLLFLLICSRVDALPETVRSRCQTVAFHTPAFSQLETLLMQKRGWSTADARLVAAFCGGRIGEALSATVESARAAESDLHTQVAEETLADYSKLLATAKRAAESDASFQAGLRYLSGWFRDVLVLQAMPAPEAVDPSSLVYAWRQDELAKWAVRSSPYQVGRFLARIEELQKAQARNVNNHLAMETLLMELRDTLLS
jgi:DNA polymerase-3 subunit delta'